MGALQFLWKNNKALTETAKKIPAPSSNLCHQNAAADDFVFT
jgi:hypothetical protein